MSRDLVLIILFMMLTIAAWVLIPGLLIKRAMRQVIGIFRQHNAVGMKNARTVQQLGLQPKTFAQRMWGLRDYKPRALEYLIQYNVVLTTPDGRLYITENSVATATWLNVKQ